MGGKKADAGAGSHSLIIMVSLELAHAHVRLCTGCHGTVSVCLHSKSTAARANNASDPAIAAETADAALSQAGGSTE